MADFVRLAATARRLIKENGRRVMFVRFGTTPLDADKPWRGTDRTGDETLYANAVFVSPRSSNLGLSSSQEDLLAKSEQVFMVSAGDDVVLSCYNAVEDDTELWKIDTVQSLRPQNLTLISFVGISQ